ncbi:MAG: HupE/UreJ family protein [Verrucomicrobiota bacterium]
MIRPVPRRTGLLPVAGIFLVLSSTAHAHMAVEGAGQIANGALHPLVTPAHVLLLLGLGLLLGMQVPLDLKTPLRVFAPVSAIALLLTTSGRIAGVYQPVLIGIALCIAILVGLDRKLPRVVRAVLCAVAAVGIGLDSAVESGSAFEVVKTLVGTWLGANVAVVYISICASNGADKKWARTGMRVVGSWIVAISLLVLAFSLRK